MIRSLARAIALGCFAVYVALFPGSALTTAFDAIPPDGAWLGPAALAPACLLATLSAIAGVVLHGVLNGRRAIDARQPIPFGSFIAPAILILWIGQILDFGSLW